MATGLGIHLTNANAITNAQAVYGGLGLGIGLFLAICAARPGLQQAGLLAGEHVRRTASVAMTPAPRDVMRMVVTIAMRCSARSRPSRVMVRGK